MHLAGAYLGLLLLLKRLLEPSCRPLVAALPSIDSTAQPHETYGKPKAELRWRHPFFTDIRKSSFPKYSDVQPSKYAEKVSMLKALSDRAAGFAMHYAALQDFLLLHSSMYKHSIASTTEMHLASWPLTNFSEAARNLTNSTCICKA